MEGAGLEVEAESVMQPCYYDGENQVRIKKNIKSGNQGFFFYSMCHTLKHCFLLFNGIPRPLWGKHGDSKKTNINKF